jgi:ArsR family transcriptional regulator
MMNKMPRLKSVDLVSLFAALADRTRLRLLNLIADREVCVCYLVEILGLSQPKISRHLAYLRRAGIVTARRDGKWVYYRLERPEGIEAASVVETVLESLKSDREMHSDLIHFIRARREPDRFFVGGAPLPVRSKMKPGLKGSNT